MAPPVVDSCGLEDGDVSATDWDNRKVRHTYIRKVYSIISVQLLVTVGIISIFTYVYVFLYKGACAAGHHCVDENEPVSSFVRNNLVLYFVSYAAFVITYLVLICCEGPRRQYPLNLILLIVFTLAMSYMTGTIASAYNTKAVLLAMMITAIVAIIVTIFCFQTKVDFTSCTGLFCVLAIVLVVTGIVTSIVLVFKYIYWLHMLYASIGAIVFTLFLAYDTQLVIGDRKYALSPEEYIFGAIMLYIDIIQIFTFLLQIIGGGGRD